MSTVKPKNLPASGNALVLSLAPNLTHCSQPKRPAGKYRGTAQQDANGDPLDTVIFSLITFDVSNAVRIYWFR